MTTPTTTPGLRRPPLPRPTRLPTGPTAARAAAAALLAALAACGDARSPTAAQAAERAAPAATIASQSDVSLLAALSLPASQSGATASPTALFALTQTGTGPNGQFVITNASSPVSSAALYATTNGTGPAIRAYVTGNGQAGNFQISNTSNTGTALSVVTNGTGRAALFSNSSTLNTRPALDVVTSGTGRAGQFSISNSSNDSAAVHAATAGTGSAVAGNATGKGVAARFRILNSLNGSVAALTASTLGLGRAGWFEIANPANAREVLYATHSGTGKTLYARNSGTGQAGFFEITRAGNTSAALSAATYGTGWAGYFSGTSKGLRIHTNPGGTGLQVAGGTKQAVVATPSGARSLYTEESSEVWFTDYGFGRLTNGRARVLLEPTFAQTVNVGEPYHVFVQTYGDAELMVRDRTPLGFVVALRGGGERDAQFSYRVVAKRLGFEGKRLEPAPWADAPAADAGSTLGPPAP